MLRIDDIDPPRERPGASASIVRTLERFGFVPDGAVRYQSTRLAHYRAALGQLAADGRLYRCRCTRRELRGLPRYPGTCRPGRLGPASSGAAPALPIAAADLLVHDRPLESSSPALRVRLAGEVRLADAVQGTPLLACGDDVVVRRRDGLVAYPLASAVDDADVDEVVRGADLLSASTAQHAILELLDTSPPAWAHVPVALDAEGRKLGKSTGAPPIDELEPLPALLGVWRFLGQPPLAVDSLDAFWREAPRCWSLAAVPPVTELPLTDALG